MFRFLEKFIEFLAMVKIALSPIFAFTLIGIACYYSIQSPLNIILGIASVVLGIILGVWWAMYIHKKHSAVEFNSRLNATPELDNLKK